MLTFSKQQAPKFIYLYLHLALHTMPKTFRQTYILLLLLVSNSLYAQIQKNESDPLGYGLKLNVNFPTIGGSFNEYGGLAGGGMGIFFTKTISNRFSWYLEPSFSSVGFRNTSDDTRFNNYYIDAGCFVYFYPYAYNTDFAFIGGIRPSYLLTHNSQEFEFGNYRTKDLIINKNENGRIDGTVMLGIGLALSPVVNLELIYNQSVSNQNSTTQILGRPSTVELNLRLNAVALKRTLDGRNKSIAEQVSECHKGVMLVMLVTPNENEIKRLKSEGKNDEVDLLRDEIKQRNTRVMKEFNRNFAFAPTFFFMDTSVYKVISGNLEGIFVNGNLDLDTAIKVKTDNYFIASFCEDISNYTKRKHFGLFVYDKQMNQLEKPFNHPNQLASPVFDYVVVNKEVNKSRRPSYLTVPFGGLIGKLNTRLFRYLN
jgi:hypothetical protein